MNSMGNGQYEKCNVSCTNFDDMAWDDSMATIKAYSDKIGKTNVKNFLDDFIKDSNVDRDADFKSPLISDIQSKLGKSKLIERTLAESNMTEISTFDAASADLLLSPIVTGSYLTADYLQTKLEDKDVFHTIIRIPEKTTLTGVLPRTGK